MTKRILLFLITGGGAGYLPWAPGTAGTLVAIPLSLGLNRIAGASLYIALITVIAFIAFATWLCQIGEGIFAGKDNPKIVVDEIAGFLVANFASPPELKPALLAFLLFRFFDIIKPFPAGRAERISGGLGVILDDLIAGIYAFVVLRLFLSWGVV
ncbi:MAG: phosphatidylglycerophosphatase A family protein [Candidatus Binatia bacterium]